jgi:cytochrome b561
MSITLRNTVSRWGSVAQLFHWVIVGLVITQFVLANQAEALPLGMAKLAALARHKSVGLTIFSLATLRLLWRWSNPVSPALPPNLRSYERVLAQVTHWGLYLLLFALPLTGWLMSSAKNYPVSWFGILQIPNLIEPNEQAFDILRGTHQVLARLLFFTAVLHLLAALRHHFFKKDDVLRRMLPFAK